MYKVKCIEHTNNFTIKIIYNPAHSSAYSQNYIINYYTYCALHV